MTTTSTKPKLVTSLPFNISPKLAYTLISLVAAWAVSHYAIELDPEVSGAIALIIASIVGYEVPAGDYVDGGANTPDEQELADEAASGVED
jgi:hypothetical protein